MNKFIKILGISILIGVLFISVIALFSFTQPTKTTVTFHNSDLNIIDNKIAIYTKQGYSVKFTEAQSVSTAVTDHWEYGYPTSKRDIKGEILVIMEK
jgi:hypothetical protein